MKSEKTILTMGYGLHSTLMKALDAPVIIDAKSKGLGGSFEDARDLIEKVRSTVQTIAVGTSYNDIYLPDHLSSVKVFEQGGNLISAELTVRTKLKSVHTFKSTVRFSNMSTLIDSFISAYADALIQIYYGDEAQELVDELNAKLEELCGTAQADYTIKFALSDSNSYIEKITDTEVVFNISTANAIKISKLPLFVEGGVLEETAREQECDAIVSSLKACATTNQFIKAPINTIISATGVKPKRRADIFIRQTHHKGVENSKKAKGGVFYFQSTEKIDGEDVDVFALVEKKETGYELVLSPFNTATNFTVDFDVMKAVAKITK